MFIDIIFSKYSPLKSGFRMEHILSLVDLPWTAGVIINIKEKLIPAIEYEKVKHHICKF